VSGDKIVLRAADLCLARTGYESLQTGKSPADLLLTRKNHEGCEHHSHRRRS
jgi:hypothetical protein